MIRGLILASAVCCSGAHAAAQEPRARPASAASSPARLAVRATVADAAAAAGRAQRPAARVERRPAPVMTLPATGRGARIPADFSLAQLDTGDRWRLAGSAAGALRSPEDNGRYAVHQQIQAQRPRLRRSVLSTALVLRVDGGGDPSLSVGGGGMAGALWDAARR